MPLHISGIYQCYKCKARHDFGKDKVLHPSSELKCPSCGTVLIKTWPTGTPSAKKKKKEEKKK